MQDLEMSLKAVIDRAKEEHRNLSGNRDRDYGSTSNAANSIAAARIQLTLAHLEQALKVLTDNK